MTMLSVLISASLELAINQALKLDADRSILLKPLMGQSLAVEVTDWRLKLVFCPTQQGFTVLAQELPAASVALSGRLVDLMQLGLSASPQPLFASGQIKLHGDLAVLQAYQTFFKQLQLDWEAVVAKCLGPVLGRGFAVTLHKVLGYKKQCYVSTCQDVQEYLQFESQVFPAREEVEDFYQDLYGLRADLERLEARINLI